MATHITLRLAWHNDGWNGRICKNPASNTYCVGCASYPGDVIREERDLEWEKKNAGKRFNELDKPPACMYSGAAFSDEPCEIMSEPPAFFNDETETKYWTIPPATACTWPYEAMYNMDGVKQDNGYDYEMRLKYSEEHFKSIEKDRSLVFYYCNYSNPLSDEETRRYLLVGVSRIKAVAPTLYYDNCSERTLERYKGFIWQRGITSHYPEQGIRLPYHRYLDKPAVLKQFAAYPENTGLCKYASKQVSDDEALGLLEQLLESARIVRDDIQDDSENWDQRIQWLETLIAELWKSRGAYPGMPVILEFLGLQEAISGFRKRIEQGEEIQAHAEVKNFLSGKADFVTGFYPHENELNDFRRGILLKAGDALSLLTDVLARCSLNITQLEDIMSEDRDQVGLSVDLATLEKNPYLLCEQYIGFDTEDRLRWSTIDRGMLPSPELSAPPLFKKHAKERLRALLLETVRGNVQQTFLKASVLIDQVNTRIKAQPEWKQNFVSEKYLSVDKEYYNGALYQREEDAVNYVYDLNAWNNERAVEQVMNSLLAASDIKLPRPVGDEFWKKVLFREDCALAKNARKEYLKAIEGQKMACSSIINKRFAAITGGAGTGKSTVVAALIKAIRKVHGEGAGVAVIAPTGKATDRLRRTFNELDLNSVSTSTIHSILAKYGWLNENMSFRRAGGKRMADFSTIIIDESSMIDLSLMAALFRAVDWHAVSRFILVGDAAQLPPIGIGKLYADTVSYLRGHYPGHLVVLTENLRQLENRAAGKGNGILELAGCFINNAVRGHRDETEGERIEREQLIRKLHDGGDIDKDLRIVYWTDPEAMQTTLIDEITRDLKSSVEDSERSPAKIWGDALKNDVNVMQIFSTVRGELNGTESINFQVQEFKSAYWLERGDVDGITLFDKVIQIINRPSSWPLKGYNFTSKSIQDIEIFNGEIGTVVPTGKDWKSFKWSNFRLSRVAVQFSGKEHISINYYGSALDKPEFNLELAYAISVHKSQGSEFQRIYFVLPKSSASAQMMELVYTALTRASVHCTVFVEQSIETLVNAMRPEQSSLAGISSSLFEFKPVNEAIATKASWYEAGKIHEAITGDMVRSKSEVIIANMLHERGISFWYEKPLLAPDGSLYLPDFTIQRHGEFYYWEHLGLLSRPEYKQHWEEKKAWYNKHFPGRLVTTQENSELSKAADTLIKEILSK